MVTRNSYRGQKKVVTSGLANRADKRLQEIASRYQDKFETALAVDGVVGYIWNKARGTMPCTCRGFSLRRSYDISKINQGQVAKGDQVQESINLPETLNTNEEFVYVGEHITHQKKDAILSNRSIELSNKERLTQDSKKVIELHEETGDYKDDFDILEALGEDGIFPDEDGDLKATPYINKPLAVPTQAIMCPICLGMGTVDTWTLYGGHRIVLDYSNMHVVDLDNADVDSTQPAAFTIFPETRLKWLNVYLPMQWSKLLKLALYHNGTLVSPSDYSLYFIHPTHSGTLQPLNGSSLKALNGSPLLRSGNMIQVGILTEKEELKFTHLELLFQMIDSVKLQVPELEMADDTEWADWNLQATFEVSANVEIRESSYIVEGKYKRVWKVSSINRKLTATGKSFGYSVNVRALHPHEKAFVLLNILGRPIDPFSTIVDDVLDDFDF